MTPARFFEVESLSDALFYIREYIKMNKQENQERIKPQRSGSFTYSKPRRRFSTQNAKLFDFEPVEKSQIDEKKAPGSNEKGKKTLDLHIVVSDEDHNL